MFNAGEVEVSTVIENFHVTGLCLDHNNILIGASGDLSVLYAVSPSYQVSVLVGDQGAGYRDGPLESAQFNKPVCVCTDNEGNLLVADQQNNRIRMIDKDRQVVTTVTGTKAGFLDGPASTALFNRMVGLHVSPTGDTIIADVDNGKLRKLSADRSTVSTVLAGCYPNRICSAAGDILFSDFRSNTLRRISHEDGSVGVVLEGLRCPRGVCVDLCGNVVVVDSASCSVKSVSGDGVVRKIAGGKKGDRDGREATFGDIYDVCCDAEGHLLVSDYGNKRLRRIMLGDHYLRCVSELWPSNHKLFHVYKRKCIQAALLSFLQFDVPKEILFLIIKTMLRLKNPTTLSLKVM